MRRSGWGFVAAWFFIILSPTSSFIPVKDPIFEHRVYLSLAAVVAAGVLGVHMAVQMWLRSPRLATGAQAVLLVTAIMGFGWRTVVRNADYHSGIAMWESVIAVRPESPRAIFSLGAAMSNAGRHAEAVEAYRKAIKYAPNDVGSHTNMCSSLRVLKRYDEAIAAGQEAVRLKPRRFAAHYNLALALDDAERNDEAIMHYEAAVLGSPKSTVALKALGDLHRRLGDADNAERAYLKALAINPDYARLRVNYGSLLQGRRDIDGAIEQFAYVIDMGTKRVDTVVIAKAWVNYGNALWARGQKQDAIGKYKQAIGVHPTYVSGHYVLGWALGAMGNTSQAIKHLERALALDPSHAKSQAELARLRDEAGD